MLQDQFLQAIVEARIPVTVYLVNGIRLLGEVQSYDQYGLMLSGNAQQLIYKRAISTIVPARDVDTAKRVPEKKALKD